MSGTTLRAPGAIHSTVTKRLAPWSASTSSEDLQGHRQVGVLGVLVDHKPTSDCSSASLPEMSDTWTTLTAIGGFLLETKKVCRAQGGNRKGAGQANT